MHGLELLSRVETLTLVTKNGDTLEYVNDIFKSDKEIVLAAVKQNGWALKYADDSFKKDKEIVLAAVNQNGYVLKHLDDSFKKDKEIVLAAVKRSGCVIQYADDSLKKDKDVVLAALKESLLSRIFINKLLRCDFKICKWIMYYHEKYVNYDVLGSIKIYRFLNDPIVAKKYFNVFKYGNGIKFQSMIEQSDIRIRYLNG